MMWKKNKLFLPIFDCSLLIFFFKMEKNEYYNLNVGDHEQRTNYLNNVDLAKDIPTTKLEENSFDVTFI